MTLDAKLRWKESVKKKETEFDLKYRKYYWLIGRNSKLIIYKTIQTFKKGVVYRYLGIPTVKESINMFKG